MQARLLLGPAGSGKTFRCLTEIREALLQAPDGPPLLLLAPKQVTFQLERQLLADSPLKGYTRLHILSFERLAHMLFEKLRLPPPKMLDEQGRLMVLRAIIARRRHELKLFRASARLTGFAQQLGLVLRELQRSQLSPQSLYQLAQRSWEVTGLAYKLQDLASLLQDYLDWLAAHALHDPDSLLTAATESLLQPAKSKNNPDAPFFDRLWVDGFAELSEKELSFLTALAPYCNSATITFCLDVIPSGNISWLSMWSLVRRSFERCRTKLNSLPDVRVVTRLLDREPVSNRFSDSSVLRHLEKCWPEPHQHLVPERKKAAQQAELNFEPRSSALAHPTENLRASLQVIICPNPEAEAIFAAREILQYVRGGGRFRDAAVLVRKLSGYHDAIQRVFSRYEIPFFMDRREPVSHHPLPELTRNALRTVTFGWLHEDWFAALKTGLAPAAEDEIDKLENEALARGWKGPAWHKPIIIPDEPALSEWLSALQSRLLPPFQELASAIVSARNRPTGSQLAAALRDLWAKLQVEQRLRSWAEEQLVSADTGVPGSIHTTVWDEMNRLLDNVELAFAREQLSIREWLPILEAGLASLSVGVIPPVLDHVLVGAIDRSRNPELKLALVLGLNDGAFPVPPENTVLLTDIDHAALEKHDIILSAHARHQLARERFFAYIAFTRASRRLVLTSSTQDANGSPLSPSPFLSQLARLFPGLAFETNPNVLDWRDSLHSSELLETILKMRPSPSPPQEEKVGPPSVGHANDVESRPFADHFSGPATVLKNLPGVALALQQLQSFQNVRPDQSLRPEFAARLYGPVLRTSVSRIENFAACPFKFFVHSGLRAEERKRFELDIREQGSFQHDVLALFHEHLSKQNKRWRDITPGEARELIARLAQGLASTFRDGLLHASDQSSFMLRMMTEALQDFVETLVGWMRGQYLFDPVAVELPFGDPHNGAAWRLALGNQFALELHGRIDRIDVSQDKNKAMCVVVDYKSGQRQLDPVLLANGLQLQLLTYLNIVRHWHNPQTVFGAEKLNPAGAFYVSLRGKYQLERNRRAALRDTNEARQLAYRHNGRFNTEALPLLDHRSDAREGDQFNYRLTNGGEVWKSCRDALSASDFTALLDSVEANLIEMGRRIFFGHAQVAPYRKGSAISCSQCEYQGICRIDPWTHSYRLLRKSPE